MVSFITFTNTTSDFSLDRVKFECEEMGIFDSVDFYTEKDIDKEYMEKYGDHFSPKYKRGYGYFSWKPYIIKKKLEEIKDGDTIVYADCGCILQARNRNGLKKWIELSSNSESGILSPCYGPYIEHDWTRADLYDFINKTYNKENIDIFDKALQCGATVIIITKKDKSVDFINQWNYIMSEHFHLCTDESSSIPNHPNFKENRHDQSVFSMLSKIYKIQTIETKFGIVDKENSPIICARCKSDKNTWKKPLTVLFDYQSYEQQNFGGISRMYVDIANELNRNEIVENFTGSGLASGKYQDTYAKFGVKKTNNLHLLESGLAESGTDNNQAYTIELLNKGNFDVFYPTFFNPYFLPYLNGKPFVMSIHDMIPELYPQFFSQNDPQIIGKKTLVDKASAIEVPTNTTKRDLMRILNVPEEKIHVVGRGLKKGFGNIAYDKSIVNFKYILYVGQRNAYKRFDWFLKHITPYLTRHKDVNIVCTGTKFNLYEVQLVKNLGLDGRVFNGFVDDIQLATLYKYAECFVYPSEYEGFGIPILESYRMGCPVLLNDTDCFREVTFGKGEYFTLKENESNLSERLEEITSNQKEKYIGIRYEILKKYTWENTANKLKEIFRNVKG